MTDRRASELRRRNSVDTAVAMLTEWGVMRRETYFRNETIIQRCANPTPKDWPG